LKILIQWLGSINATDDDAISKPVLMQVCIHSFHNNKYKESNTEWAE